jgi:hypothetical protein
VAVLVQPLDKRVQAAITVNLARLGPTAAAAAVLITLFLQLVVQIVVVLVALVVALDGNLQRHLEPQAKGMMDHHSHKAVQVIPAVLVVVPAVQR